MKQFATIRLIVLISVVGFGALNAGCTSVARGVTEAMMEPSPEHDDRECFIRGRGFNGLQSQLARQSADGTGANENQNAGQPRLKILMVHGIGSHLPGYSTLLQINLAKALNLDVVSESIKDVHILDPDNPERTLGLLRISRYLNSDESQEMLFYELNWSALTEDEKESIAYDNSGEYSFQRASFNNSMKEFLNGHLPDPLIYLGESRRDILQLVGQSICWMISRDWDQFEDDTEGACDSHDPAIPEHLRRDDYAFVGHSLGSRIITDSMEAMSEHVSHTASDSQVARETYDILREKTFSVFMLANQLPLLQLGRKAPEVTGKIKAYCGIDAPLADDRALGALNIVAFNDPNDLLSYAVPLQYLDKHMDSRLCPSLVNVQLEVAEVISIAGVGEFASPLAAHSGYQNDRRVIALIAGGLGTDFSSPMIQDRCTWLQVR